MGKSKVTPLRSLKTFQKFQNNIGSRSDWKRYWNMAQIPLSYDICWDLQRTNVNLKLLKKLKVYFFTPSKGSMHAKLWWNHNHLELFTSNIKLLYTIHFYSHLHLCYLTDERDVQKKAPALHIEEAVLIVSRALSWAMHTKATMV